MAKRRRKGGVNKTKAILDLLGANPALGPKEASAELAKQGIKASPGYVSTIKSKAKRSGGGGGGGGGGGKPRRGKRRAKAKAGDSISISKLVETKRFAEKMGGVGKLKAAIDALSKLE